VIFGDPLNVFSQVFRAWYKFNENHPIKFEQPVQYTYHKYNKKHKGVGAVAQSCEYALVFSYGKKRKITRERCEITTLIPGSRTRSEFKITPYHSTEPFNNTQVLLFYLSFSFFLLS
jgi:hypothetical protein